ncbi:hypothetical protein VTL71DRAFT_13944, partial [Oculimacula yallundae]
MNLDGFEVLPGVTPNNTSYVLSWEPITVLKNVGHDAGEEGSSPHFAKLILCNLRCQWVARVAAAIGSQTCAAYLAHNYLKQARQTVAK